VARRNQRYQCVMGTELSQSAGEARLSAL
jgi:hypothetical protein